MGPGLSITALGAPVCPSALLLRFFQGPGHLGWPRLCKGKSQEQGHTRWIDCMVGGEGEERGGKGVSTRALDSGRLSGGGDSLGLRVFQAEGRRWGKRRVGERMSS